MKSEGEADIVDDVLEPISGAALHDHIADISSRVDLGGTERRILTRFPDYAIMMILAWTSESRP